MKNIFWFSIFGVLSTVTMDKPVSVPAKSTIKVPKQILVAIFDGTDARTIIRNINHLTSESSELQQFMQSSENANAVINHVNKKTHANSYYIAFYLGQIGWIKNEYAKGNISTDQMTILLDHAFTNSEINLLIKTVNTIPSLSNFIFQDIHKTTILLRAIQHAQGLPLVQAIIDNGADVNQADSTGLTPLSLAVQLNRTEALKLLLEYGADVNKKTSIESPLYYAVKVGSVEAVKRLLNAGATISDQVLQLAQNNNGSFNKEEIYKILQEKKANPNVRFGTLQIKL